MLLLVQFLALFGERRRGLDHDEAEYLHSAWLMDHGRKIYRDFMEDHPPLFFAALPLLAPSHGSMMLPRLDVLTWAARTRVAMALSGTITLFALCLLLWRIGADPAAPFIAIALIVIAEPVWLRAFGDIRADPVALALFAAGAALILIPIASPQRGVLLGGIGAGLLLIAFVINPKWPLSTLVLLVSLALQLRRVPARSLFILTIPVATAALLATWAIMTVSTLRDFIAFPFILKWRALQMTETWTVQHFAAIAPYSDLPLLLRPWTVGIAVAISAIGLLLGALPSINQRAAWTIVALSIASAIEIRVLYPYPFLWLQYYVLWLVGASLAWALAATVMLARANVAVRAIAVMIATGVALHALLPHVQGQLSKSPARWLAVAYLQQRLGPGERVWMDSTLHPIAADDASYYGYGFYDVTPRALILSARGVSPSPAIRDNDLPPCAIVRGLDMSTRFIEVGDWLSALPHACACTAELMARRMLFRTAISNVVEVRRPGQAAAPPPRFLMPHIDVEDVKEFDPALCRANTVAR